MKNTLKSLVTIIFVTTLCLTLCLSAFAYDVKDAETKADALSALGLFKGTDLGYELDKPLTRVQALVMLVRLSGNEIEARYFHSFTFR